MGALGEHPSDHLSGGQVCTCLKDPEGSTGRGSRLWGGASCAGLLTQSEAGHNGSQKAQEEGKPTEGLVCGGWSSWGVLGSFPQRGLII